MTRQQIEAIEVGQTGLYSWNPSCPVIRAHPVRESGGKVWRYIEVRSATGNGSVGFMVAEDRA